MLVAFLITATMITTTIIINITPPVNNEANGKDVLLAPYVTPPNDVSAVDTSGKSSADNNNSNTIPMKA